MPAKARAGGVEKRPAKRQRPGDAQRAFEAVLQLGDFLFGFAHALEDVPGVFRYKRPASVNAMLRVVRSNNRAPTSASRRRIDLATAEGVMSRCSAARLKLPYSALATNSCRLRNLSMI